MYNGRAAVPQTAEYFFEKPFYYNGITFDEYYVEWGYYMTWHATHKKPYKPLREQLADGDIINIPDEYKVLCPYPGNCTAFEDLIRVA